MEEWAICTIKNQNVYYLTKTEFKTKKCIWSSKPSSAKTFESKGLAEYYAATRHVRKYHIRTL